MKDKKYILAAAAVCVAIAASAAVIKGHGYVYEGAVSAGVPDGYGICRYDNGAAYYGFWSNGRRCGLGRMQFADDTFEFGIWRNGVYQPVKGQKFVPGRQCYGIDVSKYQKEVEWTRLSLPANASGKVLPSNRKTLYRQPVLFEEYAGYYIKRPCLRA